MIATTIVPLWIVLPISIALMLLVSAHMHTIDRGSDPASRRRIRLSIGWVTMLSLAGIAAGASIFDAAEQPRLFFLSWSIAVLFLLFVVGLCMLDIANTLRLARKRAAKMPLSMLHSDDKVKHDG